MSTENNRPAPKRYTMEDLAGIVKGDEALPNIEPITNFGGFLNNIAAGGHMMTAQWGWSKRFDGSRDAGRKQWTQFFLQPSEGTGYAIVYGGSRWDAETKTNVETPAVLRFAICKHEKVVGPGANHSRGWHPGWCGKCGLDMSYDSGD